ncbi:hypothetical protein [Saccharopolyspora tripterygii]
MSLHHDGSFASRSAIGADSPARRTTTCIESPRAELRDQIVVSRFVDPQEPGAVGDPEEHIQVDYPLGHAPSSIDEHAMLQAGRDMLDDEVSSA